MDNKLIWHHERNGIFTVKSAYHLARREVEMHRAIADRSSTQDHKTILWKEVMECLRSREETIEHVWRDYSMVAAVWFLTLGLKEAAGPQQPLLDWVAQLAQKLPKQAFELMLMTLWSIWRARNNLLWKDAEGELEVCERNDPGRLCKHRLKRLLSELRNGCSHTTLASTKDEGPKKLRDNVGFCCAEAASNSKEKLLKDINGQRPTIKSKELGTKS
ncbi:hypothetical protein COP2_024949 [Malus domestica]